MKNISFKHGYALIIGVGADLPVTIEDAEAVYNIIVNQNYAAYPLTQTKKLIGKNANRENVLSELDQLILEVKKDPEATVIIYYSGHGGDVDGKGYYLLTHGWEFNRAEETGISSEEFSYLDF